MENFNPPPGTTEKKMKETIKTKEELNELNHALINAVNTAVEREIYAK